MPFIVASKSMKYLWLKKSVHNCTTPAHWTLQNIAEKIEGDLNKWGTYCVRGSEDSVLLRYQFSPIWSTNLMQTQ